VPNPLILINLIVLCFCTAGFGAFAQASETELRKILTETAKGYLGVPYVYGAEAPPRAFDCSGFVRRVYADAAGIALPRSSKQMWLAGKPGNLATAKPGDVLVFDTVGGAPSHVAILLDKGSIIHAVSEGPKTGVIISSLQDRYFAPRIMGARVFVPAAAAPGTPAPATSAPAAAAQKPAASAPASSAPTAKPAAAKPAQTAPAVQPAAPQPEPAKPTPATKPAAGTPQASAPATGAPETPLSTIGFTITNQPVVSTDKIPAAVDSAIQYAVTNGTGKDGVFEILFYKMDLDPSKALTLRQDRVSIKAGGMVEVEPFVFTSPGQYKLILKTHDNLKRVERIWKVVELNPSGR